MKLIARVEKSAYDVPFWKYRVAKSTPCWPAGVLGNGLVNDDSMLRFANAD